MKIAHLSQPQPNMSSIGEGCNSLGKAYLTSLVGRAYNLSLVPAPGECDILFNIYNAILAMKAKADCGQQRGCRYFYAFRLIIFLWKGTNLFLVCIVWLFHNYPNTSWNPCCTEDANHDLAWHLPSHWIFSYAWLFIRVAGFLLPHWCSDD